MMPADTAAFVGTLAHFTGWSEYFILVELPFVRALQYYHAAIASQSLTHWTVRPGTVAVNDGTVRGSAIEQLDALDALWGDGSDGGD